MTVLTQEYVRELFDYERETGNLVWRVSRSGNGGVGSIAGHRVKGRGYIKVGFDRRVFEVHRIIWLHVHGFIPKSHIDHIDGNPSNNRLANLRPATPSQNQANRRLGKNNSSGIKGVCWDRQRHKWSAEVMVNRRKVHLGRFDHLEDAAAAYKNAAHKYFGEFARTA